MSFMKRKSGGGDGGGHGGDIDLKPFINFLVVLIPVLMLSAEFAKIAIISMKLPEGRGSQTNTSVQNAPIDDESDKLLLTMIITDSVVTIGAKGGFMPSLFYKEYHKYVAANDRTNQVTVEVDAKNPSKPVVNPKTGKAFDLNERQEILLYTTDENYKILECMYSKEGEMVTDPSFVPVTSVNVGDTVYLLSNPRRMVIVSNPKDFKLSPLIAYDEMQNRLMKIKDRYRDARDSEDIILAAENQVAYDKIIQLMDVAKAAEFPNISIAKLRS